MRKCLQETRLAYLLRVAIAHIREFAADDTSEYDDAECDGTCLANDLQHELDALPSPEEPAPPVRYRLLEVGEDISREYGDEYRLFNDPERWIPTTRSGKSVPKDAKGKYRRPITSQDEHPEYAAGWKLTLAGLETENPHQLLDPTDAAEWEAGAEAAREYLSKKQGLAKLIENKAP